MLDSLFCFFMLLYFWSDQNALVYVYISRLGHSLGEKIKQYQMDTNDEIWQIHQAQTQKVGEVLDHPSLL